MPVPLELFLARVLRQQEQHGIAQHVQDPEGQQGDAEDDDDELDDLAGEIASHGGRRTRARGSTRARSRWPYFFRGVTAHIRSTSSRGAS